VRVLVNGVSAVAGGGVTYLRNLAELLPRLAPNHHFLFALPRGFSLPTGGPNIELLFIDEAQLGVIPRLAWENFQLWQVCRETRADLLFCPANLIPLLKPKIPVVSMVRNVAPFYPQVRQLLSRYEGRGKSLHMSVLRSLSCRAVRTADHVLYLSHATETLIETAVTRVRSSVLYHGVNPHFYRRTEPSPRIPRGDFFINVSNIYVYKGIEFLIQAMKFRPELPPVYLIGKALDLGYTKAMQEIIRRDGLCGRIIFQGDVPYDELPWWYSQARAMVYTSWCENCPNILLEAMACGCPIVAHRIGPMPEICGPAAVYARPFHGFSLSEAMHRVLNPEFSFPRQQAGIARARDFSRETSILRLLTAFEQTLG
jgi:glycosyltransferase involved in cell wall biosynthesis